MKTPGVKFIKSGGKYYQSEIDEETAAGNPPLSDALRKTDLTIFNACLNWKRKGNSSFEYYQSFIERKCNQKFNETNFRNAYEDAVKAHDEEEAPCKMVGEG